MLNCCLTDIIGKCIGPPAPIFPRLSTQVTAQSPQNSFRLNSPRENHHEKISISLIKKLRRHDSDISLTQRQATVQRIRNAKQTNPAQVHYIHESLREDSQETERAY